MVVACLEKEGQSLGSGCTARKFLGVRSVSEERHRNPDKINSMLRKSKPRLERCHKSH